MGDREGGAYADCFTLLNFLQSKNTCLNKKNHRCFTFGPQEIFITSFRYTCAYRIGMETCSMLIPGLGTPQRISLLQNVIITLKYIYIYLLCSTIIVDILVVETTVFVCRNHSQNCPENQLQFVPCTCSETSRQRWHIFNEVVSFTYSILAPMFNWEMEMIHFDLCIRFNLVNNKHVEVTGINI